MVVRKNDDPECYQTVYNVSKESNSALVNTKTSSFNLLDKKTHNIPTAQSLALPSINFSVKQIVFLCVDNVNKP